MSGIYALIFWTKSKQLQTIKTSNIPVHSRYENASVKLKWKNERSKLFEVLDSKILKISDDKDLLDNISVDENTGRGFIGSEVIMMIMMTMTMIIMKLVIIMMKIISKTLQLIHSYI
ncbi:uncharacterized protein LOC123274090 [Cotesia glomerata]|uniref:uncharacterized protein LOC123274090 n=1 Tax=Cotesia glomerata TaxID=32391 RepID=UPI001D02A373|nr:uncharacterized protein LOC123274090 [Cotesia glomerata]